MQSQEIHELPILLPYLWPIFSSTMHGPRLVRWMSATSARVQPTVGTVFRLTRTFRETDVKQFVALTGDSNPIHVSAMNDCERKEQLFVNGAFLNGVIAGIIGSNFPGFVVTTQNFRFPNRCQLDKEVQFSVTVEEMRKIVTVSYESKQSDHVVFEGIAKLFAVRKWKRSTLLRLLTILVLIRAATGGKYSRFRLADVQRNSATNVPCTCAIFLTGQFNRFNRTEQPKGNPGIQLELMQHFPCTAAGNKQCANKCLDSIVKHLHNSQNVICATIDRDCFRERAYLFYQNCAPRWVNSNLSAGKEFCCQNDKPMRCNLMAELIRQSLLENEATNNGTTSSGSSDEQSTANR
ncbi:uncharacterized protein LOC121590763 [Anopheles merus]|uniref:uncharacterized protein LOC121590763 n=1 Tax=Anopheles merus TaxID=30066 RepID=UPI001BE3D648|nr:uncharacterized protein LOC121590763 [Anopheles merus]